MKIAIYPKFLISLLLALCSLILFTENTYAVCSVLKKDTTENNYGHFCDYNNNGSVDSGGSISADFVFHDCESGEFNKVPVFPVTAGSPGQKCCETQTECVPSPTPTPTVPPYQCSPTGIVRVGPLGITSYCDANGDGVWQANEKPYTACISSLSGASNPCCTGTGTGATNACAAVLDQVTLCGTTRFSENARSYNPTGYYCNVNSGYSLDEFSPGLNEGIYTDCLGSAVVTNPGNRPCCIGANAGTQCVAFISTTTPIPTLAATPTPGPNVPTSTPRPFSPYEAPSNSFFDMLNPLRHAGGENIFEDAPSAYADQLSTPGGIVSRVLTFAFPLAGLILFVMLVWGGFEILIQAPSKKGIDAGKQRVTAAIIGFILLFSSYWIWQIIEVIFGVIIF